MTITLCSKCNTMKNIEGFNDCARCMEKKEMTTKELVENFYTTFKGNRFEASMYKVKEVDGKVAPYFMEDWIEEKFKELEASIRNEVVEQVETFISKNEGWDSGTAWETMVVSSTELRKLLQGIDIK
jgi:hypothetical protein